MLDNPRHMANLANQGNATTSGSNFQFLTQWMDRLETRSYNNAIAIAALQVKASLAGGITGVASVIIAELIKSLITKP